MAATNSCARCQYRNAKVGDRWTPLDGFGFIHDRIILPQTKNGEGRVVYLNRFAQSALESLAFDQNTKPANLIFPGVTAGRVRIAFRRTVRRLGIANFRFHDLRHTAASWLRMSGADIHTVAQLLGHKDLRMAVRYQHLSSSFLTEAVRQVGFSFGDGSLPGRYRSKPTHRRRVCKLLKELVAHTGLEPVVSALRGQRVSRLHQCASVGLGL